MLQLILTIIIYLIIVIPVGVYLYHVAAVIAHIAKENFQWKL